MKSSVTQFQKWFVDNMDRAGLTVSEIARGLHTTRPTIYRHYKDEQRTPYAWIIALCMIFNDGNPEEIWGWIHG